MRMDAECHRNLFTPELPRISSMIVCTFGLLEDGAEQNR